MSFAWLDSLVLAEALQQARTTFAPEEACGRTAISRAYYAVYGAACTRARDQDGLQLPATGDAPQRVSTHYRQGPSALHRAIGNTLRRLRRPAWRGGAATLGWLAASAASCCRLACWLGACPGRLGCLQGEVF